MKPQKETGRHREAFELYLAMGASRSLEQVARKFGVTNQAVHGWSSAFGWSNRVLERERGIADKAAAANDTDAAKMVARQLKIVRAIQGKFVSNLQAGKASVGSGDFLAAAKYETHLTGFRPEGTEATVIDVGELMRVLLYIHQTKIPDSCPHCKTMLTTKADLSDELLRLAQQYAAQAATPPPAP